MQMNEDGTQSIFKLWMLEHFFYWYKSLWPWDCIKISRYAIKPGATNEKVFKWKFIKFKFFHLKIPSRKWREIRFVGEFE